MDTLDLFSSLVHDDHVNNDLLSAVATAVAIMLMVFALQALKDMIGSFWTMVRPLFSVIGLAVLVFSAMALTVGVLFLQTRTG